jgi:hypothetical protein
LVVLFWFQKRYVDITPLEPLPKHGRIEMGVMKKVLRPGKGPAPKVE